MKILNFHNTFIMDLLEVSNIRFYTYYLYSYM